MQHRPPSNQQMCAASFLANAYIRWCVCVCGIAYSALDLQSMAFDILHFYRRGRTSNTIESIQVPFIIYDYLSSYFAVIQSAIANNIDDEDCPTCIQRASLLRRTILLSPRNACHYLI